MRYSLALALTVLLWPLPARSTFFDPPQTPLRNGGIGGTGGLGDIEGRPALARDSAEPDLFWPLGWSACWR